MKIGVEATGLMSKHRGGIALYTKNLADHLVSLPDVELGMLYKLSRWSKRHLRYTPAGSSNYWYYGNTLLSRFHPHVVHCCDNQLPQPSGSKRVVTIHDVAIFKPENDIPGYTSEEFRREGFNNMNKLCLSADAIITVSSTTKQDLLDLLPLSSETIHVIPLAPNLYPTASDQSSPLSGFDSSTRPYILFVGHISIRKNILGLLNAFSISSLAQSHTLVLCGAMGMGGDSILASIRTLNLTERVVITGYLPDAQMPGLYRNASAFVFPTYYEGFGIPILEAMMFGTPVLIGNRGAAPETAGGFAVEVDPFSVEDIANGLELVLRMDNDHRQAAQAYAKSFSWHNTAQSTLNVYRTLTSRPSTISSLK